MFRTILVAVPALRRVDPAITSGPTAGAIVRSTKVCSSVRGSHVTNMILDPARLALVSAPSTNCVHPAAFLERLRDDVDADHDPVLFTLDRCEHLAILGQHLFDDVGGRLFVDGQ